MSRRLDKINRHLQRTLAEILLKEVDIPADVLVTISRVDTAPNLKTTSVWLYIQPLERADEVLEGLKAQLYDIQGTLNRGVNMRPLPRISFTIDRGSEYAQRIEEKFIEIEKDEPSAE